MAVKTQHILGMNARNHLYTSLHNSPQAKEIANSKLLTKSTLRKAKLPTPKLFRVFREDRDIEKFDFTKLPETFVVKPNKGLGGEGIIVVEDKLDDEGQWMTAQGETIGVRDLHLHIGDILEGRFSMNDLPDIALIEERVRIHPVFERYAYHGTPDIRVIVFNGVPVMAMLRLPTKESGGRANLFQGAIGAGIDLGSGITTYAIQHSSEILFLPGTRRKIRGIQIPEWNRVLELSILCQQASKLGYMGADIVLQPGLKEPTKTFPKVLELNAQPGLKIQLCNKAGLQRRLERVEGLEVEMPETGIKIANQLFGDRKLAHLGKLVREIGVFETVELVSQLKEQIPVKAKVDTGAFRTSIDSKLAEQLGLLREDNILYEKGYRSALGRQERPIVEIEFYLKGRRIKTTASVTDRSHMTRPMIIGRRDLKGYTIAF
jgi:alpha-L-glutamate ligase-like protein